MVTLYNELPKTDWNSEKKCTKQAVYQNNR